GSGNSGGGAPPPPANVAIGTQDINPTPYEQVQDGGELKWPVQDFPASFNELSGDASSSDIPPITRSVMPTPSVEQPDATFKPNPEYLTSMELVSQDPEKVTYKLNKKAHWSDGSPITWEDYRSQWQALNGKNHDFVVLSTAGYENVVDVSRGADDYEFTVTYNPKYGDWGAVFQVLYPKSMTSDPAAFNKGWADGPKLTGGPFRIGEINQTSKTVIVVRDDTWWGKKAKLDRIIFRNISTSGGIPSIDALANGGLDFASIAGNLDAYKRAQSIQGVVFRRATLPNLRWILFNGSGSSPL
ncbi:ABC transporter substrate-binding protein, partial [Kibdelosporangium lantanae]